MIITDASIFSVFFSLSLALGNIEQDPISFLCVFTVEINRVREYNGSILIERGVVIISKPSDMPLREVAR